MPNNRINSDREKPRRSSMHLFSADYAERWTKPYREDREGFIAFTQVTDIVKAHPINRVRQQIR